jgi:transcription initiation factor TFIIIB Brf1 subunit/transcription initiation factor TFIIB
MNACPKCGSENYATERRINGGTVCRACGLRLPSKEWNKGRTDPAVPLSALLERIKRLIKHPQHHHNTFDEVFIGIHNDGLNKLAAWAKENYGGGE